VFGPENRHTIAFRDTAMQRGEQFVAHLEGWYGPNAPVSRDGQGAGAIILTDSRLCFFRRGTLSDTASAFTLQSIQLVTVEPAYGHQKFCVRTVLTGLEVFKVSSTERRLALFVGEIEARRTGRRHAA
jgi:hypothetical protein